MDADDPSFDLPTLCDLAGVTARTVRYYIAQGLLPQPGAGREARKYGQGTLDRLRLIRQLQREHLPLAEIRARLAPLNDDAVAALLTAEPAPSAPLGSAREYLDAVLGVARRQAAPAPRGAVPRHQALTVRDATPPQPRPAPPPQVTPDTWPRGREQWERLRLHDDIELHVRRPASRELNRRLERLLEAARRILNEE